jgi:hypothetical protein
MLGRCADASEAFAVKASDFARSSSFFGSPVSDAEVSLAAVGCKALSLDAGLVVGKEGGDAVFLVTSAF